jgi:mono/diheme cytochrome c family protein
LVFYTLEGRHVLSEVWIGEGGVLVNATPAQDNPAMVMAVVSGVAPKMSGKEAYQRACARCHGSQGEGSPLAEAFFQTQIPRIDSATLKSKSDQELKDIISQGRGNMEPVRVGQARLQHNLYPESVGAVIGYLRTLKER